MSAFVTALVTLGLVAAPRPATPAIAGNTSPNAGASVTYVFAAKGAARYRCALDSTVLHPCAKRLTLRLTAGTHVLRVQAVDPAGGRSAVVKLVIVARTPVPELAVRQAWQIDVSGGRTTADLNAVGIGPGGNVYVTDGVDNRVVVYDSLGKLVRSFGSAGSGPGQFDFQSNTYEGPGISLATLAVDPRTGDVYVAETQRVQRFDADGRFEASLGASGLGNGQFLRVIGLTVDSAGSLYTVEDRPVTLGRVQKFDDAGHFLTTFGRGQIMDSGGVAVDAAGHVLVTDDAADVIDVFGADGRLLRKIGEPGNAPGQLNFPTALAVSGNTLVVADTRHSRMVLFDLTTGRPTGYWATPFQPYWVAADPSGAVYVVAPNGVLTKYLRP